MMKHADEFEELVFGDSDLKLERDPEKIENLYWDYVSGKIHPESKVLYASDLEGSAFPIGQRDGIGWQWNMRNLARLDNGGVFRVMEDVIAGVTDPMICKAFSRGAA